MPADNTTILDVHANTWFVRVLRWRVYDPEEALWIAATHRRLAAEARSAIPGRTDDFRERSRALWLEERAASHDEMVAVCECHAANLRVAIAARTSAGEKGNGHA